MLQAAALPWPPAARLQAGALRVRCPGLLPQGWGGAPRSPVTEGTELRPRATEWVH